jgi:four helix bundle protein
MVKDKNEERAVKYDLQDRLIEFASKVIDLAERLPATVEGRYLAGQIVRSGTSPALNYGEAQAAESAADFIHKMKICLKELRETMVSLKIIQKRKYADEAKLNELLNENNELIAIFVSSISTAQRNKKR